MDAFKTELRGGGKFEPALWLADEILWGIVKEPFPARWQRWASDDKMTGEPAIIASNWGRAKLYTEQAQADSKLVPDAAWQLGKLAAGLVSYVVQFETDPKNWFDTPETLTETISSVSTRMVEHSLTGLAARFRVASEADYTLLENGLLDMADSAKEKIGPYPSQEKHALALADMGRIATGLAVGTTKEWLRFIKKNDKRFVMVPGGVPRSSQSAMQEKLNTFTAIPRPWYQEPL